MPRARKLRAFDPGPEPAEPPGPPADPDMPATLSVVDLVTPQPVDTMRWQDLADRTTLVTRIWNADDATRCRRCDSCYAEPFGDGSYAACQVRVAGILAWEDIRAFGVFRQETTLPAATEPVFPRLGTV